MARYKRKALVEAYCERHRSYGFRSAPADRAGFYSMSTSHWRAYQQWQREFASKVMDIGLCG